MNIRKMVLVSLFVCVALGIYALESMIPPLVMIPGVKLGLANVITLVAIYVLGKRSAFAVLLIRIFLSSFLFGHMMSLIFSIVGGLLCFAAVCICVKILDINQLWATSIIGALAHNAGQIIVAVLITGQLAVAYYFLFLIIAAIITGLFTGLCAKYCIDLIKKLKIM